MAILITGSAGFIGYHLAKKILNNRFELIKGDVSKTSSKYVSKNYGFKISLLHLDM